MNSLTYVTGNYGKYISVKEKFEKEKIDINYYKYDAIELDINDIEEISKQKAIDAYNILNSPCFVIDSGFYIEDYPDNPGYPGAFVKRSGVASDIDTLLETMKNTKNRKCKFLDCLTFYDGNCFYHFYGVTNGYLSNEKRGNNLRRAKSNLWYVFVIEGQTKTLAEMSDEEHANLKGEAQSATIQFIEWYKNEYLKTNKLKLSY